MFSALGSIFSTKPRQAEHADTREEIQRHDPDFERGRKKNAPDQEKDTHQDNATVSITALKTFLENFIKDTSQDQAHKQSESSPQTADNQYQPSEIQTPTTQASSTAAKAASAYETMAKTKEKSQILLETTDQATGPTLDLKAADIRTIHKLIENLEILTTANIEYLHIERAETFLSSLENAVNKIKATL